MNKLEKLKGLVTNTGVNYGKNVISFLDHSIPYKNGEEGQVYASIIESDVLCVESDEFFQKLDDLKEGDEMIFVPEIAFTDLSDEQVDWLISRIEEQKYELAS